MKKNGHNPLKRLITIVRSRDKLKSSSHSVSSNIFRNQTNQTRTLCKLIQPEPSTSKTVTSTLNTSLVTYDSSDTDNDL